MRILADPDEVVQDRLRRQFLDDAGPVQTAGEPGGDDQGLEPLEGAGDVDPPCRRDVSTWLARYSQLSALEVQHGQSSRARR